MLNGALAKCLRPKKTKYVIRDVHEGNYMKTILEKDLKFENPLEPDIASPNRKITIQTLDSATVWNLHSTQPGSINI